MINFQEAFREVCFDMLSYDEKLDFIYNAQLSANYELRRAAERYRLIKNVNELSKQVKYEKVY